MRNPFRVAMLTACLGAVGLPVLAQERALSFSLTGGAAFAPAYFGASHYRVSPMGRFSFSGLSFGPAQFGSTDGPVQFAPGAGLRGAFRYIPERRGRNELAGMDPVGAAVELGLGLHYTAESWQVFADLRYGALGHRALAGEIGANAIYRGPDGLVLHAGPRAEFGDRRFAQTYFGVTAAESTASGLAPFSAGAGVHSLGFEVGAYQALSADWGVTGSLRLDRLRGDAAASPIVQQGRRDQFSAEIGLTRHFNLRF